MDNKKFKGKISCIKLTYKDAVESLKKATGKSLIIIKELDKDYDVHFMKLINDVVHVLAPESVSKWIPIFENYGSGVYKEEEEEEEEEEEYINVGNYTRALEIVKTSMSAKNPPRLGFWDLLEKEIGQQASQTANPAKYDSLMRIFKYMKIAGHSYSLKKKSDKEIEIHEEIKEDIDYFRWENYDLLIKEEFYHKSDYNDKGQQIEIKIDNNLNILDKDYIKGMSDDKLWQRIINRRTDKEYIDKKQYLEQFNKYFPDNPTSGGGKKIRNKVRTRSNRMKRKGKITRKNKITRRSKKIIKSKTRKNH